VLAFALQLEPSPEHGGRRDLAGVLHGRAPLPAPADPDAQVNHRVGLARETLSGFGPELAGYGVGQGPGQDRQPGSPRGKHAGRRGGLVVRMPGDPGVVEDEQPGYPPVDSRCGGVGRYLGGLDVGEPAVRIVEQRHAGHAELGAGLAEFGLSGVMQVGAGLVER
jgi:hypothetical protein